MVKNTHVYHKNFTSNTMSDSVICVLLYTDFLITLEHGLNGLWPVVDIGSESFGTQIHELWVNLIFHTTGVL